MLPDYRLTTEQLFNAKYGEVLAALLRATGYKLYGHCLPVHATRIT